jgi:hypothetical protein
MTPIAASLSILTALACVTFTAPSIAQDTQRGQQLFETHCIACHGQGIFKRAKPIVTNWPSLIYQVRRWERVAGQQWSTGEVNDVAGYLNERYYKFPTVEKQP